MSLTGKKLIILATAVILIILLLIGRTQEEPEIGPTHGQQQEVVKKPTMNIGTLKGPTGMGMVKLMEDNGQGIAALDYDIQVLGSPDDLVGQVISGEVDVAAVPTNLALILYNRTQGAVQLAAVNTLGVLYVLENGDSINSVADLQGKTVNISGKGATPDFAFRYILEENGLAADRDVLLDFKLQHAELAAALVAGDVDIALLPEPHVTTAMMRNENLRIALDITEEWNRATEEQGQLAMGCIIVQKDYAENNKEALELFLEEYRQSVEFVNQEQDQSAELLAKHEILPNREMAKRAIPGSNIVYIDSVAAKDFLEEFYQVLFAFEPKSIGGKLADEGFYYQP